MSAAAGHLLAGLESGSFESFRPDALASFADGLQLEQRLLSPGPFRCKILKLWTADSFLLIAQCNQPFLGIGVIQSDTHNLSTLVHCCGDVAVNGAPMQPTECQIIPARSEVIFRTSPDIVFTGLFVKAESMHARLEAFGIDSPGNGAELTTVYRLSAEAGARYWQRLALIRRLADHAAHITEETARELLNDLVNDYLLGTLGSAATSRVATPPICFNRYQVISRAEDYLRHHASEPVYLDRLCTAIGVSERALDYAFRDVLDISPYQYLVTLRLNRARQALLAGVPGNTSVKECARDSGFLHMPRFSQHYRRLFGELPSQTLGRELRGF
jgi:AraC family transcriptional regulator, ethanolamine operon transcriptional activator